MLSVLNFLAATVILQKKKDFNYDIFSKNIQWFPIAHQMHKICCLPSALAHSLPLNLLGVLFSAHWTLIKFYLSFLLLCPKFCLSLTLFKLFLIAIITFPTALPLNSIAQFVISICTVQDHSQEMVPHTPIISIKAMSSMHVQWSSSM